MGVECVVMSSVGVPDGEVYHDLHIYVPSLPYIAMLYVYVCMCSQNWVIVYH